MRLDGISTQTCQNALPVIFSKTRNHHVACGVQVSNANSRIQKSQMKMMEKEGEIEDFNPFHLLLDVML